MEDALEYTLSVEQSVHRFLPFFVVFPLFFIVCLFVPSLIIRVPSASHSSSYLFLPSPLIFYHHRFSRNSHLRISKDTVSNSLPHRLKNYEEYEWDFFHLRARTRRIASQVGGIQDQRQRQTWPQDPTHYWKILPR